MKWYKRVNSSAYENYLLFFSDIVSPDEDGEGGITLNDEHYFNLGVYAAIVGGLVITSMIRTIYFFVLCMRSSVNLHNSMFMRIVRTPSRKASHIFKTSLLN